MITDDTTKALTGHCYCGAISFCASEQPLSVVYCHCDSCKRSTGAPVAAFASLDDTAVTFSPNEGSKVFISLGVIDQADELVPTLHCHESERFSWLSIDDDLERIETSARAALNDSAG